MAIANSLAGRLTDVINDLYVNKTADVAARLKDIRDEVSFIESEIDKIGNVVEEPGEDLAEILNNLEGHYDA